MPAPIVRTLQTRITLAARGIQATWEAATGHLPSLVIEGAPVLHAAPWREDPALQGDPAIPPVDRRLGGTFACAPFGADDVDWGPPHGLAANAPWRLLRASGAALVATRALPRGRVTARIALRDGHPVLYQSHILDLDAPCSFAHHPMIAMRAGGRLSMPPPRATLTFAGEEGPGAALWARSQRGGGFELALSTDGTADLRGYPEAPCEDFATLGDGGTGGGWTALARHAEDDTVLILRRREHLPLTCLWWSNGGRAEAPWNGRHRGVLGIEHAICAGADGFAAALARHGAVAAEGVPTALPPGRHVIPHAILRIPGAQAVEAVVPEGDLLRIETATGPVRVPFDGGHLA